jgi:SAM-dependent methyltransferase
MTDALYNYQSAWAQKPVLRIIYKDFYRRLAAATVPGLTIEIGGGIGNLKQRLNNVVTTDVQPAPWLDCVADAQNLPFGANTASNIVMVDVLHHIEFPANFFREAERILRPDGRILMVEPAITYGSTLFYRLLHQEPVRTSENPLHEGMPDPKRDPYESNQAIPTLIATRYRDAFHTRFPNLQISRVDWFSFAAYPLSGGFKPWGLIPQSVVEPLLVLEQKLEGTLGRLAGFRMMLVIKKRISMAATQKAD